MMKKTSNKFSESEMGYTRWMEIWGAVEQEYTGLPEWSQKILFEDISAAIASRIAVFKTTQNQ